MYEKFFGLSRDPFSIAPDPRYLFMSERHREALAHLLYGLDAGGGFVLLTGEIGTGKTTVCRCFLEQIPANCNVAYIFNPRLTALELLRSVCEEFHVPLPTSLPETLSAKGLIDPLNTFLLQAHAAGRNNILIIDEAQSLSSDILEQLRLLTNLETNERKLLQIILIGQPELRSMLARPELEQLAQRVIARFHLDELSPAETTDYVMHRMAVAGHQSSLPFDLRTMQRIHRLSRGVPRRINLLCGRALLGAYAANKAQVDRTLLEGAAREVFGSDDTAHHTPKRGPISGPFWSHPVVVSSAVGAMVGASLVAAVLAWQGPGFAQRVSSVQPLVTDSTPTPAAIGAASAAGAAVSARPATPMSRADFFKALESSTATQNQAWCALGTLWGENLDSPDACSEAATKGVFCYTQQKAGLPLLRQLNRPGFLTLSRREAPPAYALLTQLSDHTATVIVDQASMTVPLAVLAETWNGTFSTLWRQPDRLGGAVTGVISSNSTRWFDEQLRRLSPDVMEAARHDTFDPRLEDAAQRQRVNTFQLTQGLQPDGVAGPLTIMQLNRVMGLTEPRLQPANP